MSVMLIALLVIAACLKAAMIWFVLPAAAKHGIVPGTVSTTHDLYFFVAKNLVDGNGYRVTPDTAETMMRGPGYVFFLAGLFKLFGESFMIAKIANLILGLGTMSLVFLLTKRLVGNNAVAAVSGMVVALHPAILFMETRVNVESLFIFLLTLFAFLLHRALRIGTLRGYFIAGLALGIVTLTRSSPIFIIPLLLLYLLVKGGSPNPIKHAVIKTGVLVVGALLVLSPWMARNYSLAGMPTFSEDLIGIAAFQGLYVTKTKVGSEGYQARIHEARRAQSKFAASKGVEFTLFEEDKFWDIFPTIEDEQLYNQVLLREAIEEYKTMPSLFIRHCFDNGFRFWFQGATPKVTLLGLAVTVPLLILAGIGVYIAIQHGLLIAPLLLIIGTLYAVHVPLIAHARYSTPLVPLLAVLAGVALNAARLKEWRRRL